MTRLFLDVDGVINAQQPEGWGRCKRQHAEGYRITWAPKMISALFSLDMELTWATTWRDKAPASIAPLIGVGYDAAWLNPSDETCMMDWSIYWKFDAMKAELEFERLTDGFVWVDDEITAEHVEWAEENGGLAISPSHLTGISPKNIEEIEEYLNEQA